MTTHTVLSDDAGLTGGAVEADGLMTAVHARYITSAASTAELIIEYREQYGISFDAVMVYHRVCRNAYEIPDR